MEEKTYGSKVAPADMASYDFIECEKLGEIFDEYINRDWAEELPLVTALGTVD